MLFQILQTINVKSHPRLFILNEIIYCDYISSSVDENTN